jgi:hypothetical protein
MKTLLAAVLIISAPVCSPAQQDKATIILPNPKLLTCRGADCSQLWSNSSANNTVFPKQLRIDVEAGCLYGMTAIYEKTISFDDMKSAIDQQYGQWKIPGFEKTQLGLWRVESEKFAIQLSISDKKDEKRGSGEAGTKVLIFLPFGGRSACAH